MGEQIDLLPVTQADREAAANLLDEFNSLVDRYDTTANLIRAGEYDEHEATQAFAKHRGEATGRREARNFVATISGREGKEIDSVDELLRLINGGAKITAIARTALENKRGPGKRSGKNGL